MIWLASRSPRRRELLQQIAVPFQVLDISIDESVIAGETPEDYVRRMAECKCRSGWNLLAQQRAEQKSGKAGEQIVVLAADTSVVVDEEILGKPDSVEAASQMLSRLSARRHEVYTGVSVRSVEREETRVSISLVHFGKLSSSDIEQYISGGEPMDKAGGYGIQGAGGRFVARLEGSYSGVMGLPLYETALLLKRAGVTFGDGEQTR